MKNIRKVHFTIEIYIRTNIYKSSKFEGERFILGVIQSMAIHIDFESSLILIIPKILGIKKKNRNNRMGFFKNRTSIYDVYNFLNAFEALL